jgi:hypothetical protein
MAATVAAGAGTALADDLVPVVKSTGVQDPQANELYILETSCSPGSTKLPDDGDAPAWRRIFPSEQRSLTFFVSVQSAQVTVTPALANQVQNATVVSLAYAVDQANHLKIDNSAEGACEQSATVFVGGPLYLVPELIYSKTLNTGTLASALDSITNTVLAAAPIFRVDPKAGVPAKFQDVGSLGGPINSLIQAFDSPVSSTKTPPPSKLKVGTTVVSTPYGSINVTLSPATDVIHSPHGALRAALRATATGSIDLSSDDMTYASCAAVRGKVRAAGYSSNLDIDYAVIHLAGTTISSWKQMLACLGPAEAQASSGVARALMYENVDFSYVPDSHFIQPAFRDIKGKFDLMAKVLGSYVQLDSPPPSLNNAVIQYLPGNIQVIDSLGAFIPGSPSTMPQFFDFLRKQGYHHIGLFSPIGSDMSAFDDWQVSTGMLAIKAPVRKFSACYADAIAIYPHFDTNNRIDMLILSNNSEDIAALANANPHSSFSISGDCGDNQVTSPKQ